METVQISAKVDRSLKAAIERYCKSKGLDMNHFIEESLVDHLEELKDIEELEHLRREPTRPLSEILEELRLDGAYRAEDSC